MSDIVERLRSSEPLPACPYDKLSPHYLTAPNDKPCAVCGSLNDPDAPDLCRGADTRIMGEAANEIEQQRATISRLTAERDAMHRVGQAVVDAMYALDTALGEREHSFPACRAEAETLANAIADLEDALATTSDTDAIARGGE